MREPISDFFPQNRLGMLTDLYELTMANGYLMCNKQEEIATFDLFIREMPPNRAYLVICGLESVLSYLNNLQFTEQDISFLKSKKVFNNAQEKFWDYLRSFKFSGDVWALPEGSIAFANEPIISITAPIIEAQIVETFLLSNYSYQSKIATKAARCVEAAQGRPIIEFGSRRTDFGAAVRGAKAAYIGGCIGSSNVMAEILYNIPSFGTQAHSWIMSFDSEQESFESYYRIYGSESTLLIDTFDTINGAKKVSQISGAIKGVRIDSGNLASISNDVRIILDKANKKETIIFASSDLNEYKIEEIISKGAHIDAFGVGTELILSSDAPILSGVYKLTMLQTLNKISPKLKLSEKKGSYPGYKQVYRCYNDHNLMEYDILGLRNEFNEEYEKLLIPMMKNGKLIYELPKIDKIRELVIKNRERLPSFYRRNKIEQNYPVKISSQLQDLTNSTKIKLHSFNNIKY